MTHETLVSLLWFGTFATALVASLADTWYTESGLKKGDVEENPWNRFLFRHVSVALATFIDISAYLFASAALFMHVGPEAGIAANVGATISETVMALRNRSLVKKQK